MDLAIMHKTLSDTVEGFADTGRPSVWSTIKWLFYLIFGAASAILFVYATYLLFKCNILGEWTRAFITLAFVILPVIGPLAFILFNNYKPICKGATQFLAPITKIVA